MKRVMRLLSWGNGPVRRSRRLATRLHRRWIDRLTRDPLLLLPALVFWLAISLIVCGAIILAAAVITSPFKAEDVGIPNLIINGGYTACYFFLILFWGYYLYCNLRCLREHYRLPGDKLAVGELLKLLLTVVFVFAAAYYALQLFTHDNSFEGIAPIFPPGKEVTLLGLLSVPLWVIEPIVDCLYFSIVTITTLGYGDIKPLTMAAKALTSLEVIVGFVWIAVVANSLINAGRNSNSGGSQQAPQQAK